MHACIHASMRPCVHASMCPCTHACMHACMHACVRPSVHPSIHPYIHTYMHTYIHTIFLIHRQTVCVCDIHRQYAYVRWTHVANGNNQFPFFHSYLVQWCILGDGSRLPTSRARRASRLAGPAGPTGWCRGRDDAEAHGALPDAGTASSGTILATAHQHHLALDCEPPPLLLFTCLNVVWKMATAWALRGYDSVWWCDWVTS